MVYSVSALSPGLGHSLCAAGEAFDKGGLINACRNMPRLPKRRIPRRAADKDRTSGAPLLDSVPGREKVTMQ